MGIQAITIFVEGLLAFVSPCILPLLPVYLVYLAGDKTQGTRQLLINALGFVTGFTVIFMALGATATALGQSLQAHRDLLLILSGVFVMILGLYYLVSGAGWFELSSPLPWIRRKLGLAPREQQRNAPKDLHFFSSFLFGVAFCSSWTPCLLTFLSAALLLSANSDTIWQGMLQLLFFSLGIGIPFILCALFFGKLKGMLNFLKRNLGRIRLFSGILLILIGLAMVTGLFNAYLGWAGL